MTTPLYLAYDATACGHYDATRKLVGELGSLVGYLSFLIFNNNGNIMVSFIKILRSILKKDLYIPYCKYLWLTVFLSPAFRISGACNLCKPQ